MSARSWTLRDEGTRPLNVNKAKSIGWQHWARLTREARERWAWLALAAKVPHLMQAHIVATPLAKNRSGLPDCGACAPTVKAAVDGLVDVGVLPDDDGEHLTALTFLPPRVEGVDGLELTIYEGPYLNVVDGAFGEQS